VIANQPLPSIHVDTGLVNGCGGCHTGEHAPFVNQWVQSAHGSGPGFATAAANASCAPCHEGKTAMAVKFGETDNYVEKSSTTPERIVCVVCHNPHGSPYQHQLRASISEPSIDNLCVKCHSRSGTPPWSTATATSAARGAHGAQGLLVIGQNVGWIPPNFTYDTNQIVSSHGTAANPRLCATCHVVRTTITDKATGAFKFQSVGHMFEAIPCTDANGIPVPGPCALAQRDFSACATSSCHIGGPAVARSAYQAVQARFDNLLDQIWTDKNANGVIDATPTDAGILPQMVARGTPADSAALNFGSTTTTVAKGTLWNAALAATIDRQQFLNGKVYGKSFATHMASGNGVHNPFLLEALLTSSIAALHTTYGLAPPVNLDLRVRATPPPGLKVSVR
jgi:predicted CXXCH cytochrome family protein